jgi:hypothetical protein
MKRTGFIVAFAILLAVGTPAAIALPPLSRQAVGKVESVDRAAQRFLWRSTDPAREMTLTWSRRTTFYLRGQEAAATALRTGQQVRISYRTPFFGTPSVRRVVILAEPHHSKK